MCWSMAATVGMFGVGAAATGLSVSRKQPLAISGTLAFFTLMEGLQVWGYAVIDQCGTPSNAATTWLSLLHIALQPLVINIFILEFLPSPVRRKFRKWVLVIAGAASAVILAQIIPWQWAQMCRPGDIMCAEVLCTYSGDWHLAWELPYRRVPELLVGEGWLASGFPTYPLAVFLLPLLYGAWRFAVFLYLVGPFAASFLTTDANEEPAIWCLFSIAIVVVTMVPSVRRFFNVSDWPLWPRSCRNLKSG